MGASLRGVILAEIHAVHHLGDPALAKRYVITLTAANRVGIMAAVTTALDELGGDIQEQSQTVVQKFFTMILAADFPDHRAPQVIVDHLSDVCRPYGMEVILKDPLSETFPKESSDATEKYYLTVDGTDSPGIMRRLAVRLTEENIDISELHAVRDDNDRSSFQMLMELTVPESVDSEELQTSLDELGRSLGFQSLLQHEADYSAAGKNVRIKRIEYPR